MYIRKTELTEKGNFRLFAANGKWKRQSFVCLLQMETENESLFSLVGKTINGNQRFQQTCPSLPKYFKTTTVCHQAVM
jgi:hypothetical protein